jgi:hypothetical protein
VCPLCRIIADGEKAVGFLRLSRTKWGRADVEPTYNATLQMIPQFMRRVILRFLDCWRSPCLAYFWPAYIGCGTVVRAKWLNRRDAASVQA